MEQPHPFFNGGDKVSWIDFEAAARGKSYSFPIDSYIWQFIAAGKVVKFHYVTDTAQMIRMAKGNDHCCRPVAGKGGASSAKQGGGFN
ncbi:hypothetical protein WGT02_23645 (plasmid) [Rhizobium sp. T1470]|uniref:hypothetical protein n=1 Tax=unclassified Rhizobium TaxID=2613769 RepID=UPI001AAE6685|nr:hypothetical protein [Rhizobium sp. T1473]MCA0804472.1 hypothetical protein [Rhizobium sp. T1473]